MRWMVLLALAQVFSSASPTETAPSVGVLQVEASYGLPAGVATLLTDQLTQVVRNSGAFGQVVSFKEIEAVMGAERSRMLSQCDSDGCMAEMAGALGVDTLLTSSVGKLGNSYVLTLRLLSVKRAMTLASVSERMKDTAEDALLDALEPAVLRLLRDAGMSPSPRSAPVASEPVRPAPTTPAVTPAPVPAVSEATLVKVDQKMRARQFQDVVDLLAPVAATGGAVPPPTRMDYARALAEIGDFPRAKDAARKVADDAAAPAALRRQAGGFLEQLPGKCVERSEAEYTTCLGKLSDSADDDQCRKLLDPSRMTRVYIIYAVVIALCPPFGIPWVAMFHPIMWLISRPSVQQCEKRDVECAPVYDAAKAVCTTLHD
ncbi:MAG: hypothetical protein AB2A00_09595 [Myxococcota bacterium]